MSKSTAIFSGGVPAWIWWAERMAEAAAKTPAWLNEVGLRIAARVNTEAEADAVRREATHLWTLGGIGTAFGVPFRPRPVIALWPTLEPRDAVQMTLTIEEV